MPEMDENDEIIFTSDDVAFAEIVIGEKLREKLGPPPLKVGDRVELAPHTDRWMMGDRFGEIVKVGTLPRSGRSWIHVKLDKSGQTKRFRPDSVTMI